MGRGRTNDQLPLGAVRRRHARQARQARVGQRMLAVDIVDQRLDPAFREAAADPGVQLVDLGMPALGG